MRNLALALAAIVLLALAPFGLGGYEVNVLMIILFYVILAVGLDLVSGYCGQFSFAQGAFYGIGAYTTAIMSRDLGTSFWVNLPAGIAVAGLFGLILGVPALRLKGHFLAIVTIAFQTIVYLTISQWTSFTGGQTGLAVPPVGPVSLFGVTLFEIGSLRSYYWLTLGVAVVALAIAWRFLKSRLGREWIAIRDDETLAAAVGLDTTRGKLTAFVASAALAGAAGVVTAHALRGVTPDDFTIWISATVVAMMVVGGKGTFIGPILGAVLLTAMPEFLGRFAEYKMFIFGVLLVVTVTLLPEGIVGRIRRLREG
ncbi:branched-chain amino acid ABC transporter permease [Phreatobacter sp. AB_2022a]|uniref:branched-chain amino acid ABC transporter permease n=1 Tax=Phreatobacter sp. AB_2022a TaxID=3003134 RepID=UPI0022876579|nr:branched-chain amino acid ABC transporter permease [Phreatobacter sp. AB_2022a]MCZ0733812.1 branched-chain amino acid ABC transporter permease [Phreatobacter sp. AB_2022a]